MMLKLGRTARGYFVSLIEVRVHVTRVNPRHILSGELEPGWETSKFVVRKQRTENSILTLNNAN